MESIVIKQGEINKENDFNMSPSFHIEKRKKEIKEILENLPRCENMQGSSGNDVPNQFIIKGRDWTLFQSYSSPIALKKDGKVYIFSDWDYSVTTGKYRNQFLNETKKGTLAKLKSGEYIAVDFEVN